MKNVATKYSGFNGIKEENPNESLYLLSFKTKGDKESQTERDNVSEKNTRVSVVWAVVENRPWNRCSIEMKEESIADTDANTDATVKVGKEDRSCDTLKKKTVSVLLSIVCFSREAKEKRTKKIVCMAKFVVCVEDLGVQKRVFKRLG